MGMKKTLISISDLTRAAIKFLYRNDRGYFRPTLAKITARFFGPFVGMGIRITELSDDCRFMKVEMPYSYYNTAYTGAHFGGGIYAMTDPFYLLMLTQILGSEYSVWDKSAEINFLTPGKTKLTAEFFLTDKDLSMIRGQTASGEKFFLEKEVRVLDVDGRLVAKVKKTIYIRRKSAF